MRAKRTAGTGKIRFPDAVESVTVVGTVTPDSCLIQ